MKQAGGNAPGAGGDAGTARGRTTLLIGFPKGLEEALSVVLAASQHAVVTSASTQQALEHLATRRVDLVVASSRCPVESVVELTAMLDRPRRTRVIVLLAGPDPGVERRYREAGLEYIMHMPVHVEDLIRAGGSEPGTRS